MKTATRPVHEQVKHLHERVKDTAKEHFVVLSVWDDSQAKYFTNDEGAITNNWPFSEIVNAFDSIEEAKASLKKDTHHLEKITDEKGGKHWLVYTKVRPLTPSFMITSFKVGH